MIIETEQTLKIELKKTAEGLRGGRKVTDFQFDKVYESQFRRISKVHFTPVEVAIRAAELLGVDSSSRVLDIGSGCGKFCIVGALSGVAHFTGIEERVTLFRASNAAAAAFAADRVKFIHGNMTDIEWADYDGFYLFNPFYENVEKSIRFDTSISHNSDKFYRYLEYVNVKLSYLKSGTRVVTYHGFGGNLPESYVLQLREPIGTSVIELWVKK